MTNEQIEKIKAFEVKMNHGYTVNGGDVTNLYNEVLNKSVAPTNCGSCIRRRIAEMVEAMHIFISKQEEEEAKKKEEEVVEDKPKRGRKKEEV